MLAVLRFGDFQIFRFGTLGIWDFEDLEIVDLGLRDVGLRDLKLVNFGFRNLEPEK